MMGEDEAEEFVGFGFKKTSIDKLTYKNEIQDAVKVCRRTLGTFLHPRSVRQLIIAIRFDAIGCKLKSELDKIETELNREKTEWVEERKMKIGKRFYKRAIQAKFKLSLSEWYWEKYHEKIMQLLADHNFLIEQEKYIPIRAKGRMADEGL